MLMRLMVVVAMAAGIGFGQSGSSAVFSQVLTQQSATGQSVIFVNVRNLGIVGHVFEWTVAGGPAGCTLLVESSLDAVSWSTASTNTCTTAGSVTLTGAYMYLTVNLSAFSGGTSPNISVSYRGYLAGQGLPVRVTEGGTGAITAFTPGSVPYAGAGGVYMQDNAQFFWDAVNKRLCILSNTCSNTLDVGGGKFYVTPAGLMGSREQTITASSAGVVPATVVGAAGQTADLFRWKSSAGVVGGGVTAAGAIRPDNGVSATGRSRYATIPVGSVAYGSLGTNTTLVAGTTYWAEVYIPANVTLTGVAVLNGATVGTDKWIVGLYATAGGAAVANSNLSGTASSGADAFQAIAFTATYAALGPARFWVAFQSNGTTDKVRTIAVSTFVETLTKSATGSFGTLPSLTVPTTVTADVGPIAYVY